MHRHLTLLLSILCGFIYAAGQVPEGRGDTALTQQGAGTTHPVRVADSIRKMQSHDSVHLRAALKTSPVRSLSAEKYDRLLKGEDLDDMALVAEINHYPLPETVLKYGPQLGLNPGQIMKLKTMSAALHRKQLEMGENIIRNEKMLDSLFHSRQVEDGSIIFFANRYGLYLGELRNALLQACYNTEDLLSDAQLRRLDGLERRSPAAP